jgi:hypothetical protein
MNKTLSYVLYTVLAFILILTIKFIVRPGYSGSSAGVSFILGVAPNFLLGFIFPVALRIFYSKLKVLYIILISCIAIVLMEFDLYFSGRSFDMYDIIASLLGMLLCIVILPISKD